MSEITVEKTTLDIGCGQFINNIGHYLSSIVRYYHEIYLSDSYSRDTFYLTILEAMIEHTEMWQVLGSKDKRELINSIVIYTGTHSKIFADNTVNREEVNKVIERLQLAITSSAEYSVDNTPSNEIQLIKSFLAKTVDYTLNLFAKDKHLVEVVDNMYSLAIALSVKDITPTNHYQLYDRLHLIKELFLVSSGVSINADFSKDFYHELEVFVKTISEQDTNNIFKKLVHFCIDNLQVIPNITNVQFANLYDKLKDLDTQDPTINYILYSILHDAPCRYNYNKVDQSGYDLLKRWITYSAILNQIDNAEFHVVEDFMLDYQKFLPKLLNIINKNIPYIKLLGLSKLPTLYTILTKVEADIAHQLLANEYISNINNIKRKLSDQLQNESIKYEGIDKFCTTDLVNKYSDLFININNLLNYEHPSNKVFINQVVAKKISRDYYLHNSSSTVQGLRDLIISKQNIIAMNSFINFAELLKHDPASKINNWNFKEKFAQKDFSNPIGYLENVFGTITSLASASQLKILYNFLPENELNILQEIIYNQISKQIKKRTSLTKMVYSVLIGKKTELNSIKHIQKIINNR